MMILERSSVMVIKSPLAVLFEGPGSHRWQTSSLYFLLFIYLEEDLSLSEIFNQVNVYV